MNFTAFADIIHSSQSPVVLLEGSRTVEDADKTKLAELGAQLARAFPNAVFRSGNATVTDSLFAEGVLNVNARQLELVLPNKSKLKGEQGERRICLEQLDQSQLENICRLTETATPSHKSLVEFYRQGKNGSPRFKAQYLLRDALKVTGSEQLKFKPATIGLFYLNSTKKTGGGTGHTIRVCKLLDVPAVLQNEWMDW
jgi:hypothetical protein